jgi:hypothetical protein
MMNVLAAIKIWLGPEARYVTIESERDGGGSGARSAPPAGACPNASSAAGQTTWVKRRAMKSAGILPWIQ